LTQVQSVEQNIQHYPNDLLESPEVSYSGHRLSWIMFSIVTVAPNGSASQTSNRLRDYKRDN